MLQECGAIQSALVRALNGSDYFTSLSRPECCPPNVAPPQNWDYGWKRCKIRVGRRLLNSAAGALPVMKTARANLSYLVSWGALIESAATSIPQARPAFRLSARRNDKNCEYLKQPTRALIIPGTAEYLTDVVCVRSTRYAEADSGLASSEEWVCEHTAWQTTTKANEVRICLLDIVTSWRVYRRHVQLVDLFGCIRERLISEKDTKLPPHVPLHVQENCPRSPRALPATTTRRRSDKESADSREEACERTTRKNACSSDESEGCCQTRRDGGFFYAMC